LNLNLRKKPVKCYLWSITFYGAESCTFRKIDQKCFKGFEMWCWRRLEKIRWSDCVRNAEVLHRIKEERNILNTVNRRKVNWVSHVLCRNCFLKRITEGKIEGRTGVIGKTRKRAGTGCP
jgi:hypothetical protein